CAWQGEIESHFEVEFAGPRDEVPEVLLGAQVRMDGIVTSFVGTDRPRRTHIVRARDESVVRTLAVDLADGMDRRQIHHVETHRCDAGQVGGGSGEGAVPRRAVLVPSSGGTGKELVPRTEQRPRPVDPG